MDAAKGPLDRVRALRDLFFKPAEVPAHAPRAEYSEPNGPPIPQDYKPPGQAGEAGEGGAKPPVNSAEERKNLEEEIKNVTTALKEETAALDLNIAKHKGDDAAIADLERQKVAAVGKSVKDRQAIIERYEKAARDRGNAALADQYKDLGAGLKTEDLEAQKRQVEVEQQINERAYRDFAATERQKVVEAKNDSDAILAIYRDWAEKARTIYPQPEPVITGIETEGIKAQQQADDRRFKDAQSNVRADAETARTLISINKSQNDIAVAQHRESKSQALADEAQYTEGIKAQIIERVRAEELANAKTPEDRKKALQDLARAENDYAASVIESQAKITAAVERENEKQVEVIKQGFEEIGSAAESAFKDLISGSANSTDKIVQTQHVAANGVVYFTSTVQHQSALANAAMKLLGATGDAVANTLLKMGTQAAAKWLGEATGHPFRDDETPSLSGVFAKMVGGLFGLGEKKAP